MSRQDKTKTGEARNNNGFVWSRGGKERRKEKKNESRGPKISGGRRMKVLVPSVVLVVGGGNGKEVEVKGGGGNGEGEARVEKRNLSS